MRQGDSSIALAAAAAATVAVALYLLPEKRQRKKIWSRVTKPMRCAAGTLEPRTSCHVCVRVRPERRAP